MKIIYVSSEAVPFAKTGGLADVAGALPKYLARRGHDITLVLPYYKVVREGGFRTEPFGRELSIPMERGVETARFRTAKMEKKGRFLFVEHPGYFEAADGLYGTPEGDFPNNSARFAFFNKAIEAFLEEAGEPVDVVHCNDWQSALLPIFIDLRRGRSAVLRGTSSVLTIHNLAYQGSFPAAEYGRTGLPADLYRPHGGLEFYGRVNFLKGGLFFADAITAVSRRYAEEIRTPEFGAGLDGVLRARAESVFGILNGVDTRTWNPETDPHIPSRYSGEKLEGKRRCKKELQRECGLEPDPAIPLVGMISRLADQKGLDITVGALEKLRRVKFQLVLLGTGDEKYHRIFRDLARRRKKTFSAHIEFDDALAHRIEAGADIFLMPSRYEPCGLNQMYSLRYGTVPVVRATGGLADTVVDCTDETMRSGTATGFRFDEYSVAALEGALRRAFALFPHRRAWMKLVRAGMAQDFSWERSASEYEKLYKELAAERAARA